MTSKLPISAKHLFRFLSTSLILLAIYLILYGKDLNTSNSTQISISPTITHTSDQTTLGENAEKAVVGRVIDGDTIELADGRKIRYIGVDTPETVDPRKPVQCFGHEASNFNKQLVEGKEIYITKDVSDTDKYGRLLRYVYLPQPQGEQIFINDYLVQNGYARVLTVPPDVKFVDEFLKSESQARQENRGLWAACQNS